MVVEGITEGRGIMMITIRTTIIMITTEMTPAAQEEMLIAIPSRITALGVRYPFKGTFLFVPNVGLIFNRASNVKAAVPA